MRQALPFGYLLLNLALAACGGEALGIGSLVMQGLQMASGGASASAAGKNSQPFVRPDHGAEQAALSDVASRAVSQSCLAVKEEGEGRALLEPATPPRARAVSAPRGCAYRDICLPGHRQPQRMLICERPQAEASDVRTRDPGDSPIAESSY